jgi:hypothetical protein
MGHRTGLLLCLLAVLAGCASPSDGDPQAVCRSEVVELRQCAIAVREWQLHEASESPDCINEDEARPGVAAITKLADRRYADQPDSRSALQEVARRLNLANLLLKFGKPAEAELLLRDVEGRCAKLP